MNNKDKIRTSFEINHSHSSFDWCDEEGKYKVNYVSYNHCTSDIEFEYNKKYELFAEGYQQAVKDMGINIQPILAAISALYPDCDPTKDKIVDGLREVLDSIQGVDHE